MREIKFRGWDEENKEMLYNISLLFSNHLNECFEEYEDCGLKIMQYTGLKDKNGKEIYEGDIFEFDDEVWESAYTSCGMEWDAFNVKNRAVIGFDEDEAKYDFTRYRFNENSVWADLHENHNLDFADFVQGLEIIGNIHENPELLEVKI